MVATEYGRNPPYCGAFTGLIRCILTTSGLTYPQIKGLCVAVYQPLPCIVPITSIKTSVSRGLADLCATNGRLVKA